MNVPFCIYSPRWLEGVHLERSSKAARTEPSAHRHRGNRLRLLGLIGAILFAGITPRSHGADRAYWVWHRTSPLTPAETEELARQNVHQLFWHAGELEYQHGAWKWKLPPRLPQSSSDTLEVIPVVRFGGDFEKLLAPDTIQPLIETLKPIASANGAVQIDFDCPDRLLDRYATTLATLRKSFPRLSVTALSHWPRTPAFDRLAGAVSEIMPMFYDLQADPTGVGPDSPPPPILDPAQAAREMAPWRHCPIPWRAGLPTFARLTVFDRTGLSRGQIPNWAWEDLCFARLLHPASMTQMGVTLLRAERATKVALTTVDEGDWLASRYTDRNALSQSIDSAAKSGAAGIILFRLPDRSDPAGWSLASLASLDNKEAPQLILRPVADSDQLELVNDSTADLPPRLAGEGGDLDRGYALEIDADAPVFREAAAGGFWKLTSHVHPDTKAQALAAVPLSTRLTLWFPALRARASLRTGLFQLSPDVDYAQLRYRILHGPDGTAWKKIPPL